MDAKSLKKLNRRELLELMVKISEQNEVLELENQSLKAQLENRRLTAREVGSLAQASLEATDLFIAADTAAKVYLENIVRIERETQERSNKLLEETLIECINMRAEAGFGPEELMPPSWRNQVQDPATGAAQSAASALVGETAAQEFLAAGAAPEAGLVDSLVDETVPSEVVDGGAFAAAEGAAEVSGTEAAGAAEVAEAPVKKGLFGRLKKNS